ncbi:MAG: diaminopimelate epimerase [Oscillospiraceae bacterium]|nr:diaminopimelate epimerase [Oscillospiraceae bacterium]
MHFTKMHGLGNDYLYVYGQPENPEALSIRLSERHFGAGSDGMIWIAPSDKADFQMRIFNADGSEAKMCGNGIRCVGKYVYDKGYTDKRRLTIETLAGLRTLDLHVSGGRVRSASVDMGRAAVADDCILDVDGGQITCTPVSVGNPHAVLFVPDVEAAPLTTLGPKLEHHAQFPGGINVEFVQILSDTALRMRVWERGSGVTMACGTGACASAAAAVQRGLCRPEVPIRVRLDGGTLEIQVSRDLQVTMTGPAETIYEGETDLC